MTLKVVVIGGAPGCGKSTLVRKLMKSLRGKWERGQINTLVYQRNVAARVIVFGTYGEGDPFPGTDRLSRTVHPIILYTLRWWAGLSWMADWTVVAEGLWMYFPRFVSALLATPELLPRFVVLEARPESITGRQRGRGDRTNEKTRRNQRAHATRLRNVLERTEFPSGALMRWRNDTPRDLGRCVGELQNMLAEGP